VHPFQSENAQAL